MSSATSSATSAAAATTRSVLGPLTTTFSYPYTCTENVQPCLWCFDSISNLLSRGAYTDGTVSLRASTSWQGAWQGQSCSLSQGRLHFAEDAGCWPPRSDKDVATPKPLNGWGVYSPGLLCPVGFATACSAIGTSVAGFGFQFAPSAAETAIGCCPTGYTCSYVTGQTSVGQTCVSVATTGSYPVFTCGVGISSLGGRNQTLPSIFTSVITTNILVVPFKYDVATVTLYAPLFQLLHQQSDLDAAATATATDGTAAASGASTLPTSALPQATDGADADTGTGLSAGAQAGIAVGVVAFVALIAGAFFLVWSLRRKRAAAGVPVDTGATGAAAAGAAAGAAVAAAAAAPSTLSPTVVASTAETKFLPDELGSTPVYEASSTQLPAQLASPLAPRYELG